MAKKKNKSLLDNKKFMFALKIIGIIFSIIVIILSMLQLFGVMENADNFFMPGLGVILFIQGIQNLKDNKELSYFSFGVGLFIYIVAFFKIFR